jgi:hypothetical protein
MCLYIISVLVCFSVSYEVLFVVDTNSGLDYIVLFDKVVCYNCYYCIHFYLNNGLLIYLVVTCYHLYGLLEVSILNIKYKYKCL